MAPESDQEGTQADESYVVNESHEALLESSAAKPHENNLNTQNNVEITDLDRSDLDSDSEIFFSNKANF